MAKKKSVVCVYDKPGSRWKWVAYTDPATKKQVHFSSKTTIREQAEQLGVKRYNEAWNRFNFGAPVSLTVEELIAWYWKNTLAIRQPPPSKQKFDSLTRATLNGLGKVVAHELTVQQIKDHIAKRFLDGVKKSSINRELVIIKAAYSAAIKSDSMLSRNPFASIKPFSEVDLQRDRPLNAEEQALALRYSRGNLRDLIWFALKTGLRVGNILALKWSDIDMTRGRFPFIVRKGNTVKTYHHVMAREVREWISRRPSIGTHVFCKPNGRPYDPPGPTKDPFKRLVKKLGRLHNVPPFTFHDLRHTNITDYLNAGGDIYLLSLNVGHSTVTMTQRYGHLSDKRRSEDMDKVSAKTITVKYTEFAESDENHWESIVAPVAQLEEQLRPKGEKNIVD